MPEIIPMQEAPIKAPKRKKERPPREKAGETALAAEPERQSLELAPQEDRLAGLKRYHELTGRIAALEEERKILETSLRLRAPHSTAMHPDAPIRKKGPPETLLTPKEYEDIVEARQDTYRQLAEAHEELERLEPRLFAAAEIEELRRVRREIASEIPEEDAAFGPPKNLPPVSADGSGQSRSEARHGKLEYAMEKINAAIYGNPVLRAYFNVIKRFIIRPFGALAKRLAASAEKRKMRELERFRREQLETKKRLALKLPPPPV